MRRLLVSLVAAAVTTGALAPVVGAAEQATVGNAATVVRTVTGTFGADIRQIAYLDDLYHNELVETGEESATEIVFLDDTKLAMGPNSSLVLDKFVYDPDPDQASFVITVTQGVFRFASGKLPKKSYTINTPTATIGIRGTTFTLTVQPEGTGKPLVEVLLEDGVALVTSCSGETIKLEAPASAAIRFEPSRGACVATTANDS